MLVASQAGRLFTQLVSMGEEGLKKGGLDIKKVTMHANFCTENIPKVSRTHTDLRAGWPPSALKDDSALV